MSTLSSIARQQYYSDLNDGLLRRDAASPDDHDRRRIAAILAFNDLGPGDAWEGRLAVQAVLSATLAVDCLRDAQAEADDGAKKCIALSTSLMREARAARRMLWQEQRVRLAVEGVAQRVSAPVAEAAIPQAAPPVAATASPDQATTPAVPPGLPAEPPCLPTEPITQSRPEPVVQSRTEPAATPAAAPATSEALAAARSFMRTQPAAAARIRADGGITQKCRARWSTVLPTDPAVLQALIRSPRKLLLAAGGANMATLPAAA